MSGAQTAPSSYPSIRTEARRVVRLLKRLGRLDEDAYPQDALQVLQAASIKRRLPFPPW